MIPCEGEKLWYVFLLSSVCSLFGGLLVIASTQGITWFIYHRCYKRRYVRKQEKLCADNSLTDRSTRGASSSLDKLVWLTESKDWAGEIISGQTVTGRILFVLVFVFSLASLGIYVYEATVYPAVIENCTPWLQDPLKQADFAFNIFFFLYFWIQFIAAPEKLSYFVEINSLIEFATVPPSLVCLVIKRSWIGLRFLRALRILTFPDVLQHLNILSSGATIRLWQLITIFLSIWMSGAGAVHLLENSGDPFPGDNPFNNSNIMTYGEALYFTIVTMSTVGYGDFSPKTSLGKTFVSIFILFALASFASYIPEIADMLFARSQYSGAYKKEKGKRHVVVCGDIHRESVETFLADFLHKDRDVRDLDVVFLNRSKPDLQLQGLLKRHFTQVKYFQGTVMNPYDLERVRMDVADACLVVANKRDSDPDTEDAANIMRVISVKNYSAKVRVCIQLLQYHNKAYLLNIPSWNSRNGGDDVICLSELKMGFLAQSCLAPGFSTLLANLFSMRSSGKADVNEYGREHIESGDLFDLHSDYLKGISQEVYIEYFSPAFLGLTFSEAASLCLEKLHVLLIAIDTHTSSSDNVKLISPKTEETIQQQCQYQSQSLSINPGPSVCIKSWTQGFFICDSHEEARRVLLYCSNCHINMETPRKMRKCKCNPDTLSKNIRARESAAEVFVDTIQPKNDDPDATKKPKCPPVITIVGTDSNSVYSHGNNTETMTNKACESPVKDNSVMRFDLTGMFHWCAEQDFDSCSIVKKDWDKFHGFKNHVVVCIFAEKDSPLIGLRNFVMPLRASNMHRTELKPIVFVGNIDFLRREWKGICNFPMLTIVSGSPMNRAMLRMVRINNAAMCILMSAKVNFSHRDDPYLIDKEVILCCLNIKAMRFEGEINEILPNQSTPQPHRRFDPFSSSTPVKNQEGGLVIINDTLVNQEDQLAPPEGLERTLSVQYSGKSVHLISELLVDSNVQFLDQDDEDSPDAEVYLTQPYACGSAFTTSVLDSLLSFSYFNPNAMTLTRTLTTGGATPELEQILAEGIGLQGCFSSMSVFKNRDRCRLTQLSVRDSRFKQVIKTGEEPEPATFVQLFKYALQKYRILCIGVYRLRDQWKATCDTEEGVPCSMRFVITKPDNNYPLVSTDLLFCLVPFDPCYNPEDSVLTQQF